MVPSPVLPLDGGDMKHLNSLSMSNRHAASTSAVNSPESQQELNDQLSTTPESRSPMAYTSQFSPERWHTRSPVVGSIPRSMDPDTSPMPNRPTTPDPEDRGRGITPKMESLEETPPGGSSVAVETLETSQTALDQVMEKLGQGIPLKYHDGKSSSGRAVVLKVLDDHNYICVSHGPALPIIPIPARHGNQSRREHKSEPGIVHDSLDTIAETQTLLPRLPNQISSLSKNAHSNTGTSIPVRSNTFDMFLPVRDIVRLDVGKKMSQVLSDPILSKIRPKFCFSIVLSAGGEDHFVSYDFEARSTAEREAIVATLMVVLDGVHHSEQDNLAIPLEQADTRNTTILSQDIYIQQPAPIKGLSSDMLVGPSGSPLEASESKEKEGTANLDPNERTRTFIHSTSQTESKVHFEHHDGEGTEATLGPVVVEESFEVSFGSNPPVSIVSPETHHSIKASCVHDKQTSHDRSPFELEPSSSPPPKMATCAHWMSFCAFAVQDITGACMDLLQSIEDGFSQESLLPSFCDGGVDDTSLRNINGTGKRSALESAIAGILGASTSGSYSFYEGRIWSLKDWSGSQNDDRPEEYRHRLRNRAAVLNAQARRLRRLRNEMSFFHEVKSASQRMNWVETTKSADENDDGSCVDNNVVTGPGNRPDEPEESCTEEFKETAKRSSGFFSDTLGKLSFDEPKKRKTSFPEDLYYDSDPGEARIRMTRRGSRRASLEKVFEIRNDLPSAILTVKSFPPINVDATYTQTSTDGTDHDETESGSDDFDDFPSMTTIGLHGEAMSTNDVSFIDDDMAVGRLVKEIVNSTMMLMWHRGDPSQNKQMSPLGIKAWIERGSRLRTSFIQPKLMWKAALEGRLQKRKLALSEQKPHYVQLLDVCRIIETTDIDRDLHPFAMTNRSFVVETCDDVFLFEAESETKRDALVYGLKLLIARLASRLIVGDSEVYNEFFTEAIDGVPGEAPGWTESYAEPSIDDNTFLESRED